MSVYQVEEYYVHVDISGTTELDRSRIKELLIENNWGDHELQGDDLIVDGFDSKGEASTCSDAIMDYLNT